MPHDLQQRRAAASHWVPGLFLALGAISSLWVLAAGSLVSATPALPNTPFCTLLFLAAAATVRNGAPARYRLSMVAGLGFCAVGDIFLMQGKVFFVAGLAAFLAGHICYLWGLTSDCPLARRKLPFVIWGMVGSVLVSRLWPGVAGSLRVPVLLYTVALLAMAAQAASRALTNRDSAAFVAATGAALFVLSDSVLAYQRFRHPLGGGRWIVLGTYFAAQGLIALSVSMYKKTAGQGRQPLRERA